MTVWWVVVVASSWALSTAIIRVFMRFAWSRRIVDVPNDRSSHASVTPRGAGIAFVTVVPIAWLGGTLLRVPGSSDPSWYAWLGVLPVALVGFADDVRSVPVSLRLSVHLVAATWTATWILGAWDASPLVLLGFAVVGIAWVTNLFNFMDGIDGFAASNALAALVGLALLLAGDKNGATQASLVVLAALAGSLVAFLAFNWHPASVFMGDVGSTTLGFTVALLTLQAASLPSSTHQQWGVLLAGFVAFAPFFLDATLTLTWRLLRGDPWWKPHRLHLFQRLVDEGRSLELVTLSYVAMSLVGTGIIVATTALRSSTAAIAIPVAWFAILSLAYAFTLPARKRSERVPTPRRTPSVVARTVATDDDRDEVDVTAVRRSATAKAGERFGASRSGRRRM